jgi:lysozyme-like protein
LSGSASLWGSAGAPDLADLGTAGRRDTEGGAGADISNRAENEVAFATAPSRRGEIMSTLTADQIAQHAYRAGFRGDALATATAVALAESSGNTASHNGTGYDDSYGLWQINMYGGLGPDRRRQFDLDADRDLFDPDENAKAAYAISHDGKTFEPWSTYQNGAYRRYLDTARKAAEKASANHGKGQAARKPDHGKHDDTGGGSRGGFAVDAQALATYTRKADQIADELTSLGAKTVRRVTGIAADSFGQVGKETGFAGALGDFSRSLEKQVAAVGQQARELGETTRKAANAYQENEDETTRTLRSADIKNVLG